ncbi:E3 ubiquitin-protein ligase RFWD3-like isoform X2 [Impatiens glandulifera]|uniref:E3 ubiquitin-protein ligase RFWD3-like isoform X2 n=1 Tax=Impatiens glandulifera TaxID=253017 RepID=UPI001FB08D28|nr:E3 ubiquitin-protein ligase RFWD3-like isoform X2 [Impatiens glandulifera]
MADPSLPATNNIDYIDEDEAEVNEADVHIFIDEESENDDEDQSVSMDEEDLSVSEDDEYQSLSEDGEEEEEEQEEDRVGGSGGDSVVFVEEKQACEMGGNGGKASSSQAGIIGGGPCRSELDACPICMDAFHSVGDHQICCLPCGHLYGLSCITRWIKKHKHKCPQCNKRCTLKDVRKIYGQAVVVDQELVQKSQFLEAKCTYLEKKDRDWKGKEIEWKKREADLKSQLLYLKGRTRSLELMSRDTKIVQSTAAHYLDQESSVHMPPSCYFLQQEMQITGGRYLDLDASNEIIVIARRLSGMAGRHVLTKVSMVDPNAKEDIELLANTKAIKDLHLSPDGKLVLLASLGKKLSVISTDSNNIVLNYDLPAAAWSCSWDVCASQYIYAGLQNGAMLMFDVRQTSSFVESLNGLTCNPIHTLRSLLPDRSVASGVRSLLSASSTGICEWNFDSSEKCPFLVPESQNQGVCISVAGFPSSNDVVASFRPKIEASSEIAISQPLLTPSSTVMSQVQGSHVLFRKVGTRSYQKLGSRLANVNSVRLPRSAIVQGQNNHMLFVSEDEASHGLALQELPFFEVVQCLASSEYQPVHDLKYARYQNCGLLGCLSDDKLQLYSTRQL